MLKKRHFFFATMLFILVLAVFPASAATQKSKALAAYRKYMAKQSGSTSFAVVYLDNNSVPELLVYGKVLTYKGGKVKECRLSSNFRSYEYSLYQIKGYYKKTGVIVHEYGGGGGASPAFIDYYSKMSGTTIKKVLGDNHLGSTNFITWKTTWTHTYLTFPNSDGVQIRKASFRKKLKALVKGKKYVKIKWRENTAANRKKYIK